MHVGMSTRFFVSFHSSQGTCSCSSQHFPSDFHARVPPSTGETPLALTLAHLHCLVPSVHSAQLYNAAIKHWNPTLCSTGELKGEWIPVKGEWHLCIIKEKPPLLYQLCSENANTLVRIWISTNGVRWYQWILQSLELFWRTFASPF